MPRRRLTAFEIAEARQVFGEGLDYARALVFENTPLPNIIAYLGRSPRPNAVTLGSTSYFPVTLQTAPEAVARDISNMAWLIHELTHQWQFQRLGWSYLTRALSVQLRLGADSYNYQKKHPSREEALREAKALGRRLMDFNMEQQGDLARHYYEALKQGRDPAPWEPFVAEFRH
jgi:hypothetical protein